MQISSVMKATLLTLLGSSNIFGASSNVSITKDWGSGFCANVSVSTTSISKEKWDISFEPQGIITTLWNAEYNQDTTTLTTSAVGVSWNSYVSSTKNASFGYCAKRVKVEPKLPQDGDLEVTQSQENSWDGGFCNRVEVRNLTNHSIDWEVSFPVDGSIFTLWNAKYVQNDTDYSTVANGIYSNNVVNANDTVSFGYCADVIVEVINTIVTPIDTVVDNGNIIDANVNSVDSVTTVLNDFISSIFSAFDVGFGGGYAIPFASNVENEKIWVSSINLVLDDAIGSNSYYSNIKSFDATAFETLQKSLKNSKFLVYWITEGWQENWFNAEKIQSAMDKGYVPVFNYWYFGDKLDGIPTLDKQKLYLEDNKRIVTFLNKLNGTKFLIMEPEFNKRSIVSSVDNQHKFASIIASAIDTIKVNTKDVYFSLAMTDTGSRGVDSVYEKCGYEMCALGDNYEWGKPSVVYEDLLSRLDFISFQEMVAQFSRDPSNSGTWSNPIPIAYSNNDIGIDYLPERILNFSKFLKAKYNKPVFLPYIAVATASWTDMNQNQKIDEFEIDYNGWENEAYNVYSKLSANKVELQNNGLFGFALMSLFDNPQHDVGGYQYFMQNEYHLGVIKSSAKDAVDIASYGDIETKSDIVSVVFDK